MLHDALTWVHKNGERWYEACFRHTLTIAQNQNAKFWEMRAATSLAQLWQRQGKQGQARELLVPISDWYKEGFATADWQEAEALLEELRH